MQIDRNMLEVELKKIWDEAVDAYVKKEYDKAKAGFVKILEYDENFVPAIVNLANCFDSTWNWAAAIVSYERALTINPYLSQAYFNMSGCYSWMDHTTTALSVVEKGLQYAPFDPDLRFNRAVINLSLGKFSEGWEDIDSRFFKADARDGIRLSPPPYWDGSISLNRKSIRLWAEQGIGDTILHLSMVEDFCKAFSPRIVQIVVQNKLKTAVATAFAGLAVVYGEDDDVPMADFQLPLGTLGKYTRRSFRDFDTSKPYMNNYPHKKDGTYRIGLSWFSRNDFVSDGKSIPLEELRDIFSLDATFVNLQYGPEGESFAPYMRSLGVSHEDRTHDYALDLDMTQFFEDVAKCDVVLTVSNTTAHVAGAMGKPGFVMIPRGRAAFWHWFKITQRCYFYPRLRLLRQIKPPSPRGKWFDGVIDDARHALHQLIERHKMENITITLDTPPIVPVDLKL